MKRLICGVALVVALAGLAVASALAAGGKGSQTIAASCTIPINGVPSSVTIHASNGGSAWINNTHWVLLSISGSFTPTGGSPVPFSKSYGTKAGLQSRTHGTCSATQTNSSGTFQFTATAAKTTH